MQKRLPVTTGLKSNSFENCMHSEKMISSRKPFLKMGKCIHYYFFIDRRLSLCHLRILTITKCTIMHFLKFLTTEDF